LRQQYKSATGKSEEDFDRLLTPGAQRELGGGAQKQGATAKFSVGQVIDQGGKKYRVTGGDLNGDPDVEPVQ
jgi:hypothetical protein